MLLHVSKVDVQQSVKLPGQLSALVQSTLSLSLAYLVLINQPGARHAPQDLPKQSMSYILSAPALARKGLPMVFRGTTLVIGAAPAPESHIMQLT